MNTRFVNELKKKKSIRIYLKKNEHEKIEEKSR